MTDAEVIQRTRSATMCPEQKELLVALMEARPELVSGKFSATFTNRKAQEMWQGIANELNSIPFGTNREWKHWRKTWHDMRTKTKQKRAALFRNINATGGGAFNAEQLTNVEERMVTLIGVTTIEGHEGTLESVVPFKIESAAGPSGNTRKSLSQNTVQQEEPPVEVTLPVPDTLPAPVACGGRNQRVRRPKGSEQIASQIEKKITLKEMYYQRKLELLEEQNSILKETGNAIINQLVELTNRLKM